MNDDELVNGMKNGEDESFVKLVDLYKKKIISLCYSFTNDYGEAEDLSQEIFISIYKNINKFRGESSISTYIYRVSMSRCIDYKRKKSIKGFLSGLFNISKSETIDLDEKAYIRECISKLPEDLRVCIVLYYYIGLSQKEIGEILQVPSKTVEGRIYRGKKKLKDQFEKEGYSVCNKNGMI